MAHKTLDLSSFHKTELDFYQALLGNALTIKDQVGDWYVTKESMYDLTNEQYAILLLKDPDFLTWQEINELEEQHEREQRIQAIRTWQLHKKLKQQSKEVNPAS